MKCVFFCHAITSCWNNGNAHFLRGVARELAALGHSVEVYEPADGWSRRNALQDGGDAYLAEAAALLPGVAIHQYAAPLDLDRATANADLVIAHEWNEPALIAALGRMRANGSAFTLLFHDTHHRAVTAPHELDRFDLDGYDGVLVFGDVLREIYVARGWAQQTFTWHEAADTALFHPLASIEKTTDLVWIGNWGDGERTRELQSFLIEPVAQLGLSAQVYGVRYPQEALALFASLGIRYGGWLPNHRAPAAFAAACATVHVPRGPYATALPGIPTIRVFEALACGIPLVSAPWDDAEGLFPPGCYLRAHDQAAMASTLGRLLVDRDLREELIRNGIAVIAARHTCRHRADELLAIAERLSGGQGRRPHTLTPRAEPAAA